MFESSFETHTRPVASFRPRTSVQLRTHLKKCVIQITNEAKLRANGCALHVRNARLHGNSGNRCAVSVETEAFFRRAIAPEGCARFCNLAGQRGGKLDANRPDRLGSAPGEDSCAHSRSLKRVAWRWRARAC